jgi:predicted DNA-binding transcriptional regulator AlpA
MSAVLSSSVKAMAAPNPAISQTLKLFDELPDSAHVSLEVVCALFGCSPATIWRRVRSGQRVSPVRLGMRTTRWKVGDLRRALTAIEP